MFWSCRLHRTVNVHCQQQHPKLTGISFKSSNNCRMCFGSEHWTTYRNLCKAEYVHIINFPYKLCQLYIARCTDLLQSLACNCRIGIQEFRLLDIIRFFFIKKWNGRTIEVLWIDKCSIIDLMTYSQTNYLPFTDGEKHGNIRTSLTKAIPYGLSTFKSNFYSAWSIASK